jgi:AraC-like DNA-binding protein
MFANSMPPNASLTLQIRPSRLGVPCAETRPGSVPAMTIKPPVEDTAVRALAFNRTSILPKQYEHAYGRRSTWPGSPRHGNADFEARKEALARLLIDDEETLNRLYNIASQIGLHILFFDGNKKVISHYGSGTKDDHQHAGVERTFNRASAGKTAQEPNMAPIGATDIEETAETSGEETSRRSFGLEFNRTIGTDRAPSISARDRSLSCLAAPVFDAESGLIGFLDVLPRDGGLTLEASALANTVLRTTARAIEERAFRKRYHREWIIALATPNSSGPGMLVAVEGQQQRIVGADRYAQSTLSGCKVNLGNGPTLWAFFEKDIALFRKGNVGDIHAGLVAIGDAEIWTAVVTPPISAALHQHIPEYASLHSRPRLDSISHFRRPAPPASSVGGVTPRALQRVREYIEEHLVENIELETLAEVAGLSKWHFARAFKQSVGTPPHCYLIQRRLERAKGLLAETDLSLAHIALKSGFSDQSHFSRRFRMFIGVTPRSFRWSKR